MFCRNLLTTFLILWTIITSSGMNCKWLNRIVEYYKTIFLKDDNTLHAIKVYLNTMPDDFEDSKSWSLDSILVLMVLIKESKAAERIHRAIRCMSKHPKWIQVDTEVNVSEPAHRTSKELILVIDHNLTGRFPSSQISLNMIRKFLLSHELEEWLKNNKLFRRMRRKNKRERIAGGLGVFKASIDRGPDGNKHYFKQHHSGWVPAGSYGNWLGDGHHIGWITKGNRSKIGHARTSIPKMGQQSAGSGKSWNKRGRYPVRSRNEHLIGGGPGTTRFSSTNPPRLKESVYRYDKREESVADWDKKRFYSVNIKRGPFIGHNRPNIGHFRTYFPPNIGYKVWGYLRGSGHDRARGRAIGGGPARTRFPSTTHHKGMGQKFGSVGRDKSNSRDFSGNFGNRHLENDYGRDDRVLGGSRIKGKFHFPSTRFLSNTRKY